MRRILAIILLLVPTLAGAQTYPYQLSAIDSPADTECACYDSTSQKFEWMAGGGTECSSASCDLNAATTLDGQGICLADGTDCPAGSVDTTCLDAGVVCNFAGSSSEGGNATNADALEGVDWGTLTNAKWCVYDSGSTEVDCNVNPVTDTTCLDAGVNCPFAASATEGGNATNADALEGVDFGTLTDGKACVYDLANTEIDCASTFLTAEVDGSTTNELEVVDETYSAANFNGGTTSAVSQDDLYDQLHLGDADDDGKIDIIDLVSCNSDTQKIETDASGVVSCGTIPAITAEVEDATTPASNWNGDTTHAPSENDLYDLIVVGDTDMDGKANVIDTTSNGIVKTISSNGTLSIDTDGVDNADVNTSAAIASSKLAMTFGDFLTKTTDDITWDGLRMYSSAADLGNRLTVKFSSDLSATTEKACVGLSDAGKICVTNADCNSSSGVCTADKAVVWGLNSTVCRDGMSCTGSYDATNGTLVETVSTSANLTTPAGALSLDTNGGTSAVPMAAVATGSVALPTRTCWRQAGWLTSAASPNYNTTPVYMIPGVTSSLQHLAAAETSVPLTISGMRCENYEDLGASEDLLFTFERGASGTAANNATKSYTWSSQAVTCTIGGTGGPDEFKCSDTTHNFTVSTSQAYHIKISATNNPTFGAGFAFLRCSWMECADDVW